MRGWRAARESKQECEGGGLDGEGECDQTFTWTTMWSWTHECSHGEDWGGEGERERDLVSDGLLEIDLLHLSLGHYD